jgi:hypothetical protein
LVLQKVTVTEKLLPGQAPTAPAVMEAQRNALLVVFVQVAACAFGAKNAMVKKAASNAKSDKRLMTTSGQYFEME